MTYGEQLKRLRLGMQPPTTQQHLADMLSVHVTTISRWETDHRYLPSAKSGGSPGPCASPSISCSHQRRWTARPTTLRRCPE